MTVEIRELIIKTQIVAEQKSSRDELKLPNLHLLKQQLVAECLKALRDKQKNNAFDR